MLDSSAAHAGHNLRPQAGGLAGQRELALLGTPLREQRQLGREAELLVRRAGGQYQRQVAHQRAVRVL
eukprot:2655686-Prymnesium_polylepis.1